MNETRQINRLNSGNFLFRLKCHSIVNVAIKISCDVLRMLFIVKSAGSARETARQAVKCGETKSLSSPLFAVEVTQKNCFL